MTFFVFSKPKSPEVQTPIFSAGPRKDQESAIVFTTTEAAKAFRKAAGWEQEEAVASLDDGQLLRWLIDLSENGVRYLAVDPTPDDYLQHRTLPTIDVEQQLQELTSILNERIGAPAPSRPQETTSVKLFQCRICGNAVERRHGKLTPECCGTSMTLAAFDTEETAV